ncbi:MAG: hypothetical protein ACJAVS_002421 [Paracoccaceae bacterium]|jgi:hypothetical protein
MIASTLRNLLLSAALIAAGTTAQAATLVGDRTYATAGDLTRIDDGGALLDFLDLTVTTRQSVSDAAADYAGDGFSVATAAQITALLDAFNIVYAFVPGAATEMTVPAGMSASFVNYLGNTAANVPGVAALGFYDDPSSLNPSAYLCISTGTCSPANVTNDRAYASQYSIDGAASIGTFLVRAGVSDVPLPAAAPLLLAGIAGLTLLGRRRA